MQILDVGLSSIKYYIIRNFTQKFSYYAPMMQGLGFPYFSTFEYSTYYDLYEYDIADFFQLSNIF